ncbi:MAG: insulinase family protein [Bacteroidetes bacterium]|nr:MAG: insulinase family protein [Bacteroidota bacterium]
MKDYQIHTLPNGIRLVHHQVAYSKISHCGFILNIGSRDEQESEIGIAHFWEHMAFKGTEKRKSFQILNRLDAVGGDLNAYTTKEKICFHASVLNPHLEKAVELLSDITFHSIFPEKEIQKERFVILEEMSMYADDPADAIHDQLDEIMYPNHSLGKNILGTTESVKSFDRNHFLSFIKKNLNNEQIIFSSVNAFPMEMMIKLAEKYFVNIDKHDAILERKPFTNYKPVQLSIKKPISQAHCMLAVPAYSLNHDKQLPFYLLTNLLGGVGMNSRLNMSLREKYGLVYAIEANYTTFVDSGLFSVYFATDPNNIHKGMDLIFKELRKLKEKPFGTMQLHKIKQQLMGQLAMNEENKLGEMLMMGKSLLDLGEIETLDEVFEKIELLKANDLQEIAQEIFDEKQFSQLIYSPV